MTRAQREQRAEDKEHMKSLKQLTQKKHTPKKYTVRGSKNMCVYIYIFLGSGKLVPGFLGSPCKFVYVKIIVG